ESVLVNGQRFRVAGVAAEGFSGTTLGLVCELWIPVRSKRTLRDAGMLTTRNMRGFFGMAMLQPGASVRSANAALDLLARRLQREYPDSNTGVRFTALSEGDGRVFPMLRGSVIGGSTVVLAVAVLVLLIACTNVAGVLLVRAAARRAEIGVRL